MQATVSKVNPGYCFVLHRLPIWNSLRSWRYCVGARLKYWRRSRVPKKATQNQSQTQIS